MELGLGGKVAVVTGAGGAICGEIAVGLAGEGAAVAVWDLSMEAARETVRRIEELGGRAKAFECDVTDRAAVERALEAAIGKFGTVDVLVNGVGGNLAECTTSPEREFFDIELPSIERAVAINYLSAIVPSQAIGRVFAGKGSGVILNVSSIAGDLPLTRVFGYSNSKAALNSFTKWLAVHMAREHSPAIRVNAIAPGFVLTEQNRYLLTDPATGEMTERGRKIIDAVPMARYGEPKEMVGAALWLVSDQASFVTGTVVPVDGGFAADAGV